MKKILIDAGHGIDTKGKRSPDGKLLEWKWNMDTANRVAVLLKEMGYDVELIKPEQTDIPLGERVRRINKYGKDSLLVSIHINALGTGQEWMKAHGWSIWTTEGATKSDTIAKYIWSEAVNMWGKERVRKDMSDGDVDYESNFYILRKTVCPAVLVENFFMDNEKDCAYLLDSQSNKECAEVIAKGLNRYLKEGKWIINI